MGKPHSGAISGEKCTYVCALSDLGLDHKLARGFTHNCLKMTTVSLREPGNWKWSSSVGESRGRSGRGWS